MTATLATLIPPTFGNRYAPMHIGADGIGLGGRFKLDATKRLVDLRMLVPVHCTPAVVWLYLQTFGTPGVLELFICPGSVDPHQPDRSGIRATQFSPPAAGAATWVAVTIASAQQRELQLDQPVHLLIRPSSGTWDGANHVELIGARSRFPCMVQPGCVQSPERPQSTFDRWTAVLYSTNSANPAGLLEQRNGNAHYLPLAVLQSLDGRFIGNPYDQHAGLDEASSFAVFGANRYGQVFSLERKALVNYLAIFGRGAGTELLTLPSGALTIELHELSPGGKITPVIEPLVVAKTTDRRFLGRSHWFGAFLAGEINLKAWPTQYILYAAAPGCARAFPEDAWLVGADMSSEPALQLASFAARRSLAVSSIDPSMPPTPISVDADMPFMGLHLAAPCSIACMDEVVRCETATNGAGVFSLHARANEPITLRLLLRNIGISTTLGGALYARVFDDDNGKLLDTLVYPTLDSNTEMALDTTSVRMTPSGDLHLRIECCHESQPGVGIPGLVLDDVCYQTVRAA